MGMENEYKTVFQIGRPCFDAPDDGVAVLDRKRKLPGHVGATHALILGCRHLAAVTAWRPALFFSFVGSTIAGFLWLGVLALSPGGFGAIDLVLIILFAVTLPWFVIGFWNATIGFLIMCFARDPVAAVTPIAG